MKIKICGITKLEDALLAAEYGADAIGFIFYSGSKRYISPSEAKIIINKLPAFLVKVGVFVDEDLKLVNEISSSVKLNAIQLHGEESQKYIDKTILPVIKAFRVKNEFDFSLLKKFNNCSFLLDAFDDADYGGTGKSFNWSSIPEKLKKNIILAGGIGSNNLDEIFSKIKPYAIDISSSIEDSPGIKNHEKLISFLSQFNKLRYC
ncbi:MAG: phosphoribosylanthranilate isomerase [Bacteroidetes bacterium]|nr:phosphoribosylanthranilate isomerase [Bacteroidota bacterium]